MNQRTGAAPAAATLRQLAWRQADLPVGLALELTLEAIGQYVREQSGAHYEPPPQLGVRRRGPAMRHSAAEPLAGVPSPFRSLSRDRFEQAQVAKRDRPRLATP